jgi:hypothetical protein
LSKAGAVSVCALLCAELHERRGRCHCRPQRPTAATGEVVLRFDNQRWASDLLCNVEHVETPQFREVRIDVMETMSGHASSEEFPPSLAESHLCLDDGSSEFGGHTSRETLGHVRLRRIYDECRDAVFESGGAGRQVARE